MTAETNEHAAQTAAVRSAILDADGLLIQEGSVIHNVVDQARGVVVEIGVPGRVSDTPLFSVGDIRVQLSDVSSRITNRYREWRHVPHREQNYRERFESWLRREYVHDDEDKRISWEEGLAVDGIMTILSADIAARDRGCWPNRLEEALGFLVRVLSDLDEKSRSSQRDEASLSYQIRLILDMAETKKDSHGGQCASR